ncbi:MAG: hypothetical protein HY064_13535 [Bacteroidetes bacterium]|nr:hypothetical protein [Bacteroidota bacterium]
MAADENIYVFFDRFLLGEMKDEERAAFEKKLSLDKELRDEFEWLKQTTMAMKESGRKILKQHIAAACAGIPLASLENYSPSVNRISFIRKWWWAFAVAGIIAAAAVWFFLIPHHHDTENKILPVDSVMNDAQKKDSANEKSSFGSGIDSIGSNDSIRPASKPAHTDTLSKAGGGGKKAKGIIQNNDFQKLNEVNNQMK